MDIVRDIILSCGRHPFWLLLAGLAAREEAAQAPGCGWPALFSQLTGGGDCHRPGMGGRHLGKGDDSGSHCHAHVQMSYRVTLYQIGQ